MTIERNENMNLDINIYVILEEKYKRVYDLPDNWDNIGDFKVKNNLLASSLNNKKKLEELEEYKKIIEERGKHEF